MLYSWLTPEDYAALKSDTATPVHKRMLGEWLAGLDVDPDLARSASLTMAMDAIEIPLLHGSVGWKIHSVGNGSMAQSRLVSIPFPAL